MWERDSVHDQDKVLLRVAFRVAIGVLSFRHDFKTSQDYTIPALGFDYSAFGDVSVWIEH